MNTSPEFGRLSAVPPPATDIGAMAHVQMSLGLRSLSLVDVDDEMQRRFAYAVTAAMTAKGWKGPDLARKLGLHPTAVLRWVKGESVPNILITKRLAEALGVKPEFLYDPPAVPDYPLSEYLVRQATEQGTADAVRPRQRRATARGSGE
jgi:transcriptional regulator with XRE-family HTH domain